MNTTTAAVVIDIETAPRNPVLIRERGFTTVPRYFEKQFPETDDEHWTRWHDETAQLDPARSYISAIGLTVPGLGGLCLFGDNAEDEHQVLDTAAEIICGDRPIATVAGTDYHLTTKNKLVGHNLLAFDIPYLLVRLLLARLAGHGLYELEDRLTVSLGLQKSTQARFLDTKEQWKKLYPISANSSSLDSICAALGMAMKPGNGKDFYTWDLDTRREYLNHDLNACAQVARLVFPARVLGWEEIEAEVAGMVEGEEERERRGEGERGEAIEEPFKLATGIYADTNHPMFPAFKAYLAATGEGGTFDEWLASSEAIIVGFRHGYKAARAKTLCD